MFRSLHGLLAEIWNNETNVTWEEFRERVEDAYAKDELSGTEYDWLLNSIMEGY